jgi:hypothetical protein
MREISSFHLRMPGAPDAAYHMWSIPQMLMPHPLGCMRTHSGYPCCAHAIGSANANGFRAVFGLASQTFFLGRAMSKV